MDWPGLVAGMRENGWAAARAAERLSATGELHLPGRL